MRTGKPEAKVRLADVAAAAGVSVPTVSKVVRGRADVAAETRSRVEALLAEYNYSGPRRLERPGLIELVFTDELNPWAVEIICGAERAALARGYRIVVSVLVGQLARDPAVPGQVVGLEPHEWLAKLSAAHPDGVILALTGLPAVHRERLAALRLPVVVIDPVGHPEPGIPSVVAANWAGALAATEHLIKLGHRRIATITGRAGLACSSARAQGYRVALERAGIPIDPALVAAGDFRFGTALRAATRMLSAARPPTAIFTANDIEAMGVYEAARLRRLRIPEDVSVVGFDNLPMSAWLSPPLTTVAQPLARMAETATRLVIDGPEDGAPGPVGLPTSLVVRLSTAPPRRKAQGFAVRR